MVHFGTVVRYFDDRGYGFIKGQIDGEYYFVHVSDIQDGTLFKGYQVAFSPDINKKNGKKIAKNVIVVEAK